MEVLLRLDPSVGWQHIAPVPLLCLFVEHLLTKSTVASVTGGLSVLADFHVVQVAFPAIQLLTATAACRTSSLTCNVPVALSTRRTIGLTA